MTANSVVCNKSERDSLSPSGIRERAGRLCGLAADLASAEKLSKQNLQAFFDEWLFTAAKPASLDTVAAAGTSSVKAAAKLGVAAADARKQRPLP